MKALIMRDRATYYFQDGHGSCLIFCSGSVVFFTVTTVTTVTSVTFITP